MEVVYFNAHYISKFQRTNGLRSVLAPFKIEPQNINLNSGTVGPARSNCINY